MPSSRALLYFVAVVAAALPVILSLRPEPMTWVTYAGSGMPPDLDLLRIDIAALATLLLPAVLAGLRLWWPSRAARVGAVMSSLAFLATITLPVGLQLSGVEIPWESSVCQAVAVFMLLACGKTPFPRLGLVRAAAWTVAGLAVFAAQFLRFQAASRVELSCTVDWQGEAATWWTHLDTAAGLGLWAVLVPIGAVGGRVGGALVGVALLVPALYGLVGQLALPAAARCGPVDTIGWPYLVAALLILAMPMAGKIRMPARESAG